MAESRPKSKEAISNKTFGLILLIVILAGVVAYQQYEISGLQHYKNQLQDNQGLWANFSSYFPLGPSYLFVSNACASLTTSCQGYSFALKLDNVCTNTSFYGSCNFNELAIYLFDTTKDILSYPASEIDVSVPVPQGQNVTFHGNWLKGFAPSLYDLLIFEIETTGGVVTTLAVVSS